MKIMRFIILLVATASASTCADPDGASGAAATDQAYCENLGYSALLADQSGPCAATVVATENHCTALECCETPRTGTWAGDANSDKSGNQSTTFGTDIAVVCNNGYESDYTAVVVASDPTQVTGGPCAAKTGTWTGDANSDKSGNQSTTFGVDIVVTCTAGYESAGSATYTAVVDGTNADNIAGGACVAKTGAWAAGDANSLSGAAAGVTLTFGTDITVVCNDGYGVGASKQYTGVVNADPTTGVTGGPCALQACIVGSTSGTYDSTSGAEEIICAGVSATPATHEVTGDSGSCACAALPETFAWAAGDENSDVPATTALTKDAATTVTCNTGYVVGTTTDTTYTVTASDATTFTIAPTDAVCTAKVIAIPAKDLANTNFATGHAAATVTFGDAAGAAITCNVGYFGADGKFVAAANGTDIDETLPTCTACSAIDDTDNVVPTAWVVPDNATGSAWDCTEADKSGFSAWACAADYEKNTAGDACVKKTTTTAPKDDTDGVCNDKDGKKVTTITKKADCTGDNKWVANKVTGKCNDKDGKEVTPKITKKADCTGDNKWVEDEKAEESSAFMVGTVIAGIALLL